MREPLRRWRTFLSVSKVDDEDHWRQAVAGAGESFGVIFDRHVARVRRHARALTGTTADAEDVVAVAFLEAWRRRDQVRLVGGSMLPWLLRTATNAARNLRRSSRRYTAMLARLSPAPHVADHADRDFGDGHGMRSLRSLPLHHQQVITLCVLEDLTIDEAAAVLGIRPGTVKSRLSRAKAAMRADVSTQRAAFRVEGIPDES